MSNTHHTDNTQQINDQMSAFEYHVLPNYLDFEQKYPDVTFESHVELMHGCLKLMRDYTNFRKALKLYSKTVMKTGIYYHCERDIEFQGEKTTFVTVRFAHIKDNSLDKFLDFSFRENGDQYDGHANYNTGNSENF